MSDIALPGCTPEPLMSYLKALGVFRLVAEQADPSARLSWANGVAVLHTKLDREALTRFFLDEYKPTPVVTPWNSASGFAPTKPSNNAPKDKEAKLAVARIVNTVTSRFEPYRDAIRQIQATHRGDDDADTWKMDYLTRLRGTVSDAVVGWLDACFALTNDALPPFPLLGSGGNDGVLDFASLHMQRLGDVLLEPKGVSLPESLLRDSLFAGIAPSGSPDGLRPPVLMQATVGQFNPRGVGGPNAAQGAFDVKSEVNPWDFVLMMEGILCFAGGVSRRLGATGDKAVFPFTVESVAVGNGSFSDKESRTQGKEPPTTGELWLPLWGPPITLSELKHLFAEGRAQIGRRQARNSVEFGLAVCTLGVSRGIDAFVRYGFLRRNGKSFLATPLGQIAVAARPPARLLEDPALVGWLDRFRATCRENDGKKDKVPARYKAALRRIDRTMFTFTCRSQTGASADHDSLLDVLRALGNAERVIATQGLGWLKDKQYGWRLQPFGGLRPNWADELDGVEFRLASSLASILPVVKNGKLLVGPFRHFLEPVEGYPSTQWTKSGDLKTPTAVWSNQPLADNLAAVFRRRQLEAFREGVVGVPLKSNRPARLDDVLAFLHGDTDDDKLANLLWGLIAVDWRKVKRPEQFHSEQRIPTEFGIPRLLVAPVLLKAEAKGDRHYWRVRHDGVATTPDADVFHTLPRNPSDATDRAARRLRAGGFTVRGYRNRARAGGSLGVVTTLDPTRLLAAMLFPLSPRDLSRVANAVLHPPEPEE